MISEEEGRRNVREVGKNGISLFLKSSILIKKTLGAGNCVSISVSAKGNKFVNFDF